MRSFSKLGLVATMFLATACGAAEETDAEAPAQAPAAPVAQSEAPKSDAKDERQDLADLVLGAGKMDTNKKADAEPVQTKAPEPVELQDGAQIFACTQTSFSLTKVPEKFVALNPNADVLWPGSLVQGKSMAGGILDPIPVHRAPGTITLTLASGGGKSFFRKLEEPSLSSAIQAQNEILAGYSGGTPAKFSYSFESIYSSKQLAVAVDANVDGTNWSGSASLAFDSTDAKSRVLIQFTQEFYTMAFDPPKGAAGAFASDVTANDLKPYVANGNPPVYVASVTYGRMFYLLFESTESQTNLEAAVSGSYSGGALSGSVTATAKYKTILNNATVKSYGIGGNAKAAIDAAVTDPKADQFTKIREFLVKNADFNKDNPGVPISYTIRYLGDSTQVKLALTTEYTAKDCKAVCESGTQKVLDVCGVCGGNGSTCKACDAGRISGTVPSYGTVNFNLGAGENGKVVTLPAGNYRNGGAIVCKQLHWTQHQFKCNAGRWDRIDGKLGTSGACDDDVNASYSDGTNSINATF